LQVLEELRIPVDYVAGTSMGAIVGGLYAAGVSPAEMQELLGTTDWRDLLEDRPPRRRLPYRRKVDDQAYLTRFEAGFNDFRFQLPTGLVQGQKLTLALQEMLLRVSGTEDFDQLPLPFRAVATDLETGEAVVLGRGDLALSIRASAAVPAIFSPIEIADRVLVDGGVVLNLPVDVAREMGAEVILAVDVGEPLQDRKNLESLTSVLQQMTSLQSRQTSDDQASRANVVMRPDLEGFHSTDFDRGMEMVPRGVEAARRATPELLAYSLSEADFAEHLARRRRPPPQAERIADVQLSLDAGVDPELARRRVRLRPGDVFDMEALKSDLERLFETGDYERIDALLTQEEDGVAVNIQGHEKPWGPNVIRIGTSLMANFDGDSSFGLLASYTMTRLNRHRGELKVTA
ncbi:MAG: patatin-like phospholipase family protein, partial [Acidobacteria bacterium]|nr:patatin-like phospholipase family protein [Acidobacteriota bacterium]